MDPLVCIGIVLGALLAINIGGNNSAVEFGPVYGAGVSTKRRVLLLSAIFSVLGAFLASGKVLQTVSFDIFSGHTLNGHIIIAIAILISTTLLVGFANKLRVPIATSHAMVGALTGAAIYLNHPNWSKLMEILVWWLVTPVVSLVVAFTIGRFILNSVETAPAPSSKKLLAWSVFLTLSGCYQAFSAGSNGLAKAIAPLVSTNMLPLQWAVLLGGLGMGVGAMLIGPKLMETVGKEITPLNPVQAGCIQLISGSIVLISSLSGIPVSLAEITTCAIIGIGSGQRGIKTTMKNRHIGVIAQLWPLCPFLAACACFGLIVAGHYICGVQSSAVIAGTGAGGL